MNPSLIEQLQAGAVDGTTPINDLLRKAKLAAVKLGATDFAKWVDYEMGGYLDRSPVPEYRMARNTVQFLNPYHGWQPIHGLSASPMEIRQAVSEVARLADTKSGFLTSPVPERLRAKISNEVGYQCQVAFHLSTVSMHTIMESVRNTILEWTLKLESAGIRGEGLTFSVQEKQAAQNVVNNFHGPVAGVAQGGGAIHEVRQRKGK